MAPSTSRNAVAPLDPERFLFARVRPQTAFDDTLKRLQDAIKLGLLAPGAKLPAERELCTRLGISRSTLRQALVILTQMGYVHAIRGRGGGTFVVARPPPVPAPSAQDLTAWRETCNERLAVELGAVVLAAARSTPDSISPLKQVTAELDKATDEMQYCRLDRQFHMAIASLAASPQLILTSLRVQSRICDLLASIDVPGPAHSASDEAHQEIIAALLGHDRERAIRAMCRHLDETFALLDRELQVRPLNEAQR